MSDEIRVLLKSIANSLQLNGYYHVVSSPRKLGETTIKINNKRKKNHKRINKVVDEKIAELTR